MSNTVDTIGLKCSVASNGDNISLNNVLSFLVSEWAATQRVLKKCVGNIICIAAIHVDKVLCTMYRTEKTS